MRPAHKVVVQLINKVGSMHEWRAAGAVHEGRREGVACVVTWGLLETICFCVNRFAGAEQSAAPDPYPSQNRRPKQATRDKHGAVHTVMPNPSASVLSCKPSEVELSALLLPRGPASAQFCSPSLLRNTFLTEPLHPVQDPTGLRGLGENHLAPTGRRQGDFLGHCT